MNWPLYTIEDVTHVLVEKYTYKLHSTIDWFCLIATHLSMQRASSAMETWLHILFCDRKTTCRLVISDIVTTQADIYTTHIIRSSILCVLCIPWKHMKSIFVRKKNKFLRHVPGQSARAQRRWAKASTALHANRRSILYLFISGYIKRLPADRNLSVRWANKLNPSTRSSLPTKNNTHYYRCTRVSLPLSQPQRVVHKLFSHIARRSFWN